MTAFEQGWHDAEIGRARKECPYARGTGAATAWRQGYDACYAAADENANI